jgi:hypothetical protein
MVGTVVHNRWYSLVKKTDETNDDEDKKKKVPNGSLSLAEEGYCLKKDQSTMKPFTIVFRMLYSIAISTCTCVL